MRAEYEIYDGDQLLFKAVAPIVSERLGIPREHIASYSKNGCLFKKRYRIVSVNEPQPRKKKYYDVFLKNGKYVTTGTQAELRLYFGDEKFRACHFLNCAYKRAYLIFPRGEDEEVRVKEVEKKTEKKKENYMLDSLRIYGNTITPKKCDINLIVSELKNEGVEVKYRKIKSGGYILEIV